MRDRTVLLVEDDDLSARGTARLLRSTGLTVTRAASGAEARGLEDRFDLGVLDLDLPDGRGEELAADLLATDRIRRCVFLSGCRDPERIQRAARVASVIGKGSPADVLVAALTTARRPFSQITGLPLSSRARQRGG